MRTSARAIAAVAVVFACPAWAASPSNPKSLVARSYDSQFAEAHDTYNSMGVSAEGKVYYVLSSASLDVGAKMCSFDPASGALRTLGDLTEICGEQGLKAVPQGKSHVNFVQSGSKLYFATHVGYYSIIDGMERMPVPPAGYKPYPGGHVLSYDTASGQFEDLARAPGGEGVLALNMDCQRGRIYCLTWPKGHFFRVDLATRQTKDFGVVAGQGEDGRGRTFFTICRSIAVDPRDGSAYFTLSTGAILRYRCDRDCLERVAGESLRKDYFGLYDPNSPGHMGYNWRQVVWQPQEKVFYGVHGNSGYLFRFDPRAPRVELIQRITSLPSQRAGMFDQFSYGYLGFALGPDQRTLFYLTGGPIYENGRRLAGKASTAKGEAKGVENLHLVTFNLATGAYADHGPIFFADGRRPSYVNSIAVGKDSTVYFLSRITRNGQTPTDLVSVKP